MCYQDRLYEYEKEKKKLQQKGLTSEEYMKAVIRLADKWRI